MRIEFFLPGLDCLLSEALASAADGCHDMREHQHLCLHLSDRLRAIPAVLSVQDREKFSDILCNFVHFLSKRSEKSFIKRLANNRKVDETIRSFHEALDTLTEDSDWKLQWEDDRKARLDEFRALANHRNVLVVEKDSVSFKEGLFMLKFELDFKADQYNDEISSQLFQLVRRTFNKLLRMSNVELPVIPDWFIPSDDVDFDTKNSFDCGSYGSVHRGTWSKGAAGGKGAKVVVKCLLVDDDEAKDSFYKEVDVWRQLDHPHVLKLYGACHVSSPAFFVCDEASHGSFSEFLEQDSSQLWRLFYEAALGLGYLHAKKVVHGDLKCTNLLVGSDYKAKICDFGFSYVRSQSVALSAKSQTEAIRWKAPECLMPLNEEPKPQFNPRFASDVYSFGMCIIEALQKEVPFGIIDDDEIMMRLFEQQPYPRPDGMKDDEWALVEALIHPDYTKRISLAQAINKLKEFADREEEQISPRTTSTTECSTCRARMPFEFAFCGNCGNSMALQRPSPEQEKNSCPRCDGSVQIPDHFCRHCGFCLETDPTFA
ncbi:hypothetical protein DVH05_002854 [Phytophthora capsici]|nr:hypothetical protein DVH05_002854 [Phytophthora capsici]